MPTIPRVTVRLTGPNLEDGPITALLRVGDTFRLVLAAEDCEPEPATTKYDYVFEVLSID